MKTSDVEWIDIKTLLFCCVFFLAAAAAASKETNRAVETHHTSVDRELTLDERE